jgi:hypothetical protein
MDALQAYKSFCTSQAQVDQPPGPKSKLKATNTKKMEDH